MKILKVFLGSSITLKAERELIGDAVRKLSDKLERNEGIRIKLLVWEDYDSEYDGTSKQEEYNEDLVKRSDVATFLLDDKIGCYTQREIGCAIKQEPSQVVCFYMNNLSENVQVQLQENGLTSIPYDSCSDYITYLEDVIIPSLLSRIQDVAVPVMTPKYFYGFVPVDLAKERAEFGNMMRSLDDIVEANCNMRCIVLPYNHLETVNHYVALLNNHLTDDERNDLLHTFEYQSTHKTLDAISVFVKKRQTMQPKKTGMIFDTDTQLGDFVRNKEVFPTNYTEIDTIKLRLLLWFLKQKQILLQRDDGIFSIQDHSILFHKQPIASLDSIDDPKLLHWIEKIKQESNKLSSLAVSSDNNAFDEMCNRISRMRDTLSTLLYQNLIALSISQTQSVDASERIDSNAIVEQVTKESTLLHHLNDTLVEEWENKITILASRCEYIRRNLAVDSAEDVRELKQVARDWTKVAYKIYEQDRTKYELVIDSLAYQVGINDTYLKRDEDNLYKEVIDIADKEGMDNLNIEKMRFNYANSLSRIGKYQASVAIYKEVIRRIESFEVQSFVERRTLTHLYVTLFHTYFEYTPHGEEARRTLFKFGNKVKAWLREDYETYLLDYACYLSAYIRNLPIMEEKPQVLEEAEDILGKLEKLVSPSDEYYQDVPCYFLNMIASYYVDRMRECQMSAAQKEVYFRKGIKYSLRQIRDCGHLLKYDNRNALQLMSNAYHQIGYAYAYQLRDWQKSYKSYLKGIDIRYRLSRLYPDDISLHNSIAETSVNIGGLLIDVYRNGLLPANLKENLIFYANQALNIYQQYGDKNSEGAELHIYEAKLLKGTTIHAFAMNHELDYDINEGIKLVDECWRWHIRHPYSDYAQTFEEECRPILFGKL